MKHTLWRECEGRRYFLIPPQVPPSLGTIVIGTLDGRTASVEDAWLVPYEITEEQAHRVAKHQLGDALGELRGAIDETLAGWRQRLEQRNREPVRDGTTITPNAGPALLRLLMDLPQAIGAGLSGDERRLADARRVMASVEAELKDAGIDVGGRLGEFPDRLATIKTSGKGPEREPGER